jgi:hypothetical protein
MGRTVTRLRNEQTGVDRYNNPVFEKVPTDIPGALFAPERSSGEVITVGRVVLTSAPTLYWLKERPDIAADDQIEVDGVVYDVDGKPAAWTDDLGGSDLGGLVVTLKRVTG